ncbi:MAG: PAS domain S-box protein [Candidatus Synoicihabitans palmerolidicus]|nr:PAS domain S-box protein [Candidatus Synoicihabitans palmerolidicus]
MVSQAAMTRARDTGEASMSGPVNLFAAAENVSQPDFVIFLPVYHQDSTPTDIEQRRTALIGHVFAPLRMDTLIRNQFDHVSREVDVQIYGSASNVRQDSSAARQLTGNAPSPPRFHTERTIPIFGHPWILSFASNPIFEKGTASAQAFLVAFTGTGFSALLFFLIFGLESRFRSPSTPARAIDVGPPASVSIQNAILQNARTAIIVTDLEGLITLFNPAAEDLVGYSAAEMIGKHTPEVIHDQQEIAEQAATLSEELCVVIPSEFRVLVAKADLNLPNTYEWSYIHKDETFIPVLLSVSTIRDAENSITGYLFVATNQPDRKAAEKKLAAGLHQVNRMNAALNEHDIVAITDVRGIITDVNQKFCAISGYARSELVGKNHRILNSHTHDREFFTSMWKVISQGRTWHGEICNRAKDGTRYWVDTTIVPFTGTDGKPEHYIAIRTDITAQKRNVALLNDSQRLAAVGAGNTSCIPSP